MSSQAMGFIVGGILPALLFGISAIFQKLSNQGGIGLGIFLFSTGTGICAIGTVLYLVLPSKAVSFSSGGYAFLMGMTWAVGVALVAVGLTKYGVPLSKLVPLYNMNTLVAVLLGLWIFGEWQSVAVVKLALGALLIVIGGTLVASS